MNVKILDIQKEVIPLSENRYTTRWLVVYLPEGGIRSHVYIYKDSINEADIIQAIREKQKIGGGLIGKTLNL